MKKQNVLLVLMLVSAVTLTAQNPALQTQIQQMETQLKQQPDNFQLNLNLGKLYFSASRQGDKNSLKSAVDYLEKATKLEPENSSALCWYGSALTLKAKYAVLLPMKSYYVIAGLKEMDKAVELDANNVECRFIRGQTCLQLPDLFNRIDTAVEDYEKLQQMMTYAPDNFDHETQAQILYYLGQAYAKNSNDEKSNICFNKIKTDYGDTEYISKIN